MSSTRAPGVQADPRKNANLKARLHPAGCPILLDTQLPKCIVAFLSVQGSLGPAVFYA